MYESLYAYRLSQLIGHCFFTVLASARPCTLFYCATVKLVFGNLGLLVGYGAKPIGSGLGRDTVATAATAVYAKDAAVAACVCR